MNILRILMTLFIVGILGCANAVPVFQDQTIPFAIESAKSAMLEGSYGAAINFLRSAKSFAAIEHAVLPTEVKQLRHLATTRRIAEISTEIVLAYHQMHVQQTLALADEAILIANEDGVKVPSEILRIKSRTERHYFEPVFYGVPPHLIHRNYLI